MLSYVLLRFYFEGKKHFVIKTTNIRVTITIRFHVSIRHNSYPVNNHICRMQRYINLE